MAKSTKRRRSEQADAEKQWLSRRLAAVLAVAIVMGLIAFAFVSREPSGPQKEVVQVYRLHNCSCVDDWIFHLREAGLTVQTFEPESLTVFRQARSVPVSIQGCHTASVDGYFIEGHVPGDKIKRLISEKPLVLGIATQSSVTAAPGTASRIDDNEPILLVPQIGPPTIWEAPDTKGS